MSRSSQHHRPLAAIGLRAGKGGAVAVALAASNDKLRLLASCFLPTHDEDDTLALEPYRIAAEMVKASQGDTASAAKTVAEGRRRQDTLATHGLGNLIATLDDRGVQPAVVALLVNRAGWITDLLSYILAWAEHVPVAEGLAVRDAFRQACHDCGIGAVELDEKSLADEATKTLCMSSEAIDAQVKVMGSVAGTPWRKEHKHACLAAWMAMASLC